MKSALSICPIKKTAAITSRLMPNLLAKKNDMKLFTINPPPNESRLNSAANWIMMVRELRDVGRVGS